MQSEIQIVDTHESLETRFNIGFYAIMFQFNRTLLKTGSEEDALRRIQALIEAGSNPAISHLGKSAIDYARKAKYRKVVEFLTEAIEQRARQTP